MTEDLFSVFIIGPMGKKVTDPSHTMALKEAVEKILPDLGLIREKFRVKTPDELRGTGIVNSVFHEMDMADLAIADISYRSPNVFYEIAFFNALGTPMIIFDLEKNEGEDQDIPFYWNQSRIEFVRRFDLAELAPRLKASMQQLMDDKVAIDLNTNPISQFYDFPMVDISAATGIAVGYFDNFVKNVIAERTGAIAASGGKLRELIIIRPESLNSFNDDEYRLNQAYPDFEKGSYDAPISRRGAVYLNHVTGNMALDLPTALYTLNYSPRYKKLSSRLTKFPNYRSEDGDILLNRLGQRMIDAFFQTLKYLILEERGMSNNWRIVRSGDLG